MRKCLQPTVRCRIIKRYMAKDLLAFMAGQDSGWHCKVQAAVSTVLFGLLKNAV